MLFLSMVGYSPAQDGEISDEENFSGVRVRNAEILGRVFAAGDREEEEEHPAENVIIQVRDFEEDEDILSETRTDKEGSYELPRFDVGTYWLHVGKLRLEMRVVAESDASGELPKIIIVLLPESLLH